MKKINERTIEKMKRITEILRDQIKERVERNTNDKF